MILNSDSLPPDLQVHRKLSFPCERFKPTCVGEGPKAWLGGANTGEQSDVYITFYLILLQK
jgi:hypothetical protein